MDLVTLTMTPKYSLHLKKYHLKNEYFTVVT